MVIPSSYPALRRLRTTASAADTRIIALVPAQQNAHFVERRPSIGLVLDFTGKGCGLNMPMQDHLSCWSDNASRELICPVVFDQTLASRVFGLNQPLRTILGR